MVRERPRAGDDRLPRAVPADRVGRGAAPELDGGWVSQHFAFPVLVAVATARIAPRSALAGLALLYPLGMFLVIVGTRHHYLLDCVVGALSLGIGALCALAFTGQSRLQTVRRFPRAACRSRSGLP